MLERIQQLLAARELSASQFADSIGVSRPVVSHLLSGRNKPSLEVVQKVLAAFPDLSVSWLLNGEGSMLAQPTAPTMPAAVAPVSLPKPVIVAEAGSNPEQPPLRARTASAAPVVPTAAPVIVAAPEMPLPAAAVLASSVAAEPGPIATPPSSAQPQPVPNGTAMAMALAEPGKTIRRIVLFYQDGTFADFRPEASS